MKKVLMIMLALVFVVGNTDAQASTELNDQDGCELLGSLSKAIMSARQRNMPMQDLMRDFFGDNSQFDNVARGIVIDAYETPLFNTEQNKKVAITEFQNKWYLECVKSGG